MAKAMDLSAVGGIGGACFARGSRRNRNSSGFLVALPCRKEFRRAMVSCSSTGGGEASNNSSIRVTVESPGAREPVVVDVPGTPASSSGKGEDIEPSRESVTHVASESAVESPEQVHHEAESEAESIATKSGKPLERVAEEIEAEADQAASEFEHSDGATAKGNAAETVKNGSESARQGLEVAKEAMQKRAKVLAMAAEEAGQKGSQFVDAAKKGIQDLKEKLESSGVFQQEKQEDGDGDREKHSAVDVEDVNKDGEATLKEQRKQAEDIDKHRSVDVEDVNKDGEEMLKKQRKQDESIKEVMQEFVDPALESMPSGKDETLEIGDGNEHLKNAGDQVPRDAYAPIDDVQ